MNCSKQKMYCLTCTEDHIIRNRKTVVFFLQKRQKVNTMHELLKINMYFLILKMSRNLKTCPNMKKLSIILIIRMENTTTVQTISI